MKKSKLNKHTIEFGNKDKSARKKTLLKYVNLIPKDLNNIANNSFEETETSSEKFLELLNNGEINIMQKDSFGWGYLHYAAARNNSDIIKALIKKGANIEEKSIDMETPLLVAVIFENISAIKTLLKYDANKYIHDKDGNHLLYIAKIQNNKELNNVLNLENEMKNINIFENSILSVDKMIEEVRNSMSKEEAKTLSLMVDREISTRIVRTTETNRKR